MIEKYPIYYNALKTYIKDQIKLIIKNKSKDFKFIDHNA